MDRPVVLVTAEHLVPIARQILLDAGTQIEFMAEPITEAALIQRVTVHAVHAILLRGSKPITARGPVIEESALVDALRSGHLDGAGLDTFAVEPLPIDSALRALDNVILTPHVAGVTRNAARQVATITARNVVDALAGRALPQSNVVVNDKPGAAALVGANAVPRALAVNIKPD